MENNTIGHLKGKTWYRFLEVAFFLSFLVFIIVSALIAARIYRFSANPAKTVIVCIDKLSYASDLVEKSYDALENKVYITNVNRDKGKADAFCEKQIKQNEEKRPLFYPQSEIRTQPVFGPTVKTFSLLFVGGLLFFSLIQRAFYYIVLGKMFPKK